MRPDDPHGRARVGQLGTEREGVGVPDHLGDRVGDDVTELAGLRRRARRHSGKEDRVLCRAEVLGDVLHDERPGRLLELDVWVLVGQRRRHVPVGGREDHLVALGVQARHGLVELRPDGDVLLEGRFHLAAEHLLHVQAAGILRLRPPSIVVRAYVDPRHLVRRRSLCRRRSRAHEHGRDEPGR